jgi:hypothetical protein
MEWGITGGFGLVPSMVQSSDFGADPEIVSA